MEFASYLAGERWSDHPSCTHPLLSQLARGVNDHISDEARADLVPLIPSVVGLNGDDPTIDVGIVLRGAAMALPVAAHDRQRALAAGILATLRLLDDMDNSERARIDDSDLVDHAGRALTSAPRATSWAKDFIVDIDLTLRTFRRRSAPNIVRMSVLGIADACISDRDRLLHGLLAAVIHDCTEWLVTGSEASFSPATLPVKIMRV
jgi:hypothetical protein